MNEEQSANMTPLDAMLSEDAIQILKAAIPYFPTQNQPVLSICAKFMELFHTMAFFRNTKPDLTMMSASTPVQPTDFFHDIRQFTSGPTRDRIDQIILLMETMQWLSNESKEDNT